MVASISNDDMRDMYQQYRDDIERMLQYCREYGIEIPDAINSTISSRPPSATGEGEILRSEAPMETSTQLGQAISIHGKLTALIAPVTPRSLAATEFPPRTLGAWLTYGLIAFLIATAAIGIIGYIQTLPTVPQLDKVPEPVKPGNGLVGLVRAGLTASATEQTGDGSKYRIVAPFNSTQLNYLSAAALGASFKGLLTAYGFIATRQFDYGYVARYVIRVVLGVVAGMILGNLGSGLFEGTTLSKLGPGMISLLGGYSAGAVTQILDRLVEVLSTVVRGKDDLVNAERVKIAKQLVSISEAAASNPSTPLEVREALSALLRKLQQQPKR